MSENGQQPAQRYWRRDAPETQATQTNFRQSYSHGIIRGQNLFVYDSQSILSCADILCVLEGRHLSRSAERESSTGFDIQVNPWPIQADTIIIQYKPNRPYDPSRTCNDDQVFAVMNRRWRIVVIGSFPEHDNRGGMGAVITSHLQSPLQTEFDFLYLHTSSLGGMAKKIAALLASWARLLSLTARNRFDLAHIHTASWRSFYRKLIFVWTLILARKKVLLHIHGGQFQTFFDTGSDFRKFLISKTLNHVDAIIVVSDSWLPVFRRISTHPTIVPVVNPVDVDVFADQRAASRQNKRAIDILFIGHLTREKGIYDLLDAFQGVVANVFHARLHLCGTGPIADLEEECAKRNLSQSVVFHGWISGEAKVARITESDIFVLPSYHEGLPVSLLEAMAAGLPLVVTPVGGIPDAVQDGVHGFLVPPGDVAALTDRLTKLAQDASLRAEFSGRNRRAASERYDVKNVALQIRDLYLAVLEGKNHHVSP